MENQITKISKRCCKCSNTNVNSDALFHRFAKPGKTNIERARLWAKWAFPDKDNWTVESLYKLWSSNVYICSDHFSKNVYVDAGRLSRFAVPIGANTLTRKEATCESRVEAQNSSMELPIVEDLSGNDIEESLTHTNYTDVKIESKMAGSGINIKEELIGWRDADDERTELLTEEEILPYGLNALLQTNSAICRLCLGRTQVTHDIFQKSSSNSIDPDVPAILDSIPLSVKENDGLPQKICDECYSMLTTWYSFKEMCISTQITLKQFLNNITPEEGYVSPNKSESTSYSNPSVVVWNTAASDEVQEQRTETNLQSTLPVPNKKTIIIPIKPRVNITTQPAAKERQVYSIDSSTQTPKKIKLSHSSKKNAIASKNEVLSSARIYRRSKILATEVLLPTTVSGDSDQIRIPCKRAREPDNSDTAIKNSTIKHKARVVEVIEDDICNITEDGT